MPLLARPAQERRVRRHLARGEGPPRECNRARPRPCATALAHSRLATLAAMLAKGPPNRATQPARP
eukprot:1396131-Alexandrium_andersonii.AAC.1